MRLPLPVVLCAAVSTLLAAEPPKLPKLLDPELKLEAFASAPDVEVPTTVCAAPDGSVYIGCDPRDARLNTDQPEDYIVRYSSMGPDRKRTVFADKIYSPAGSQWHDGWLYVLHDPFLTRFKDTNGDGVADVREDLVTNLGIVPNPGLNDHVVSGFVLGMDGYFYISVGDRGIYQAHGKDGSEISLQGGGMIRCRPDGTKLEVVSSGTRNHLAILLDGEDNAFSRDNTDDGNGWWTRVTHHIEGGYYGYPFDYRHAKNYGVTEPSQQTLDAIKQHSPGEDLQPTDQFLPAMADFGGGSPTGGVAYLSDGLPEKYRGKLLFTEWGKGALFSTEVVRDGGTFKLVNDTRVVEGDKGADFRPMQVNVAPDGSLLIADWGFGGWKAPKTVGTVWRVSWPEAKPVARLKDEAKVSPTELVAALGHPDRDQRLRAQSALVALGAAAPKTQVAALLKDSAASPAAKSHALWTLAALGETAPIAAVARDGTPALKVQALRAYPQAGAAALKDGDASVRLQAAIALGRASNGQAAPELVAALGTETDPWIRFALSVALRKQNAWADAATWLTSEQAPVANGAWRAIEGVADAKALAALTKVAAPGGKAPTRSRAVEAIGLVAYQDAPYDGHWWGTQPVKNAPPLKALAWDGTATALAALQTALGDAEASVRAAAAEAFTHFQLDAQGAPVLAALRGQLKTEKEPAVQRQLIEALGVQKDPQAMDTFMSIALDEKADADFRTTAIGAVVNIGGDGAKQTIAKLATAKLSPAATRKVIQAAGELRVLETAPALIAHLADETPGDREAAAKSLGQLGPKSNATEALIAALKDKDSKVLQAVVDALGGYKDKAALPALIEFAKTRKARKELLNALSGMPDPQAIPVLVAALDEKSSGTRRNVLTALAKMKTESWPAIDQAIAGGKVPAEFVPEIRGFFDRGLIAKWKVLGPFENVWGAVHPPETDTLAKPGGVPDLATKYLNAEGKQVGWIDTNASNDDGRVSLDKVFKTQGMVCAYAYTDIEATEAGEAKFLAGSDDQLAVWLNGQKVFDSGASPRGFLADQHSAALPLVKGHNSLFVKIGNLSGTWEFGARVPGLDGTKFTPSKEPSPEEKQRAFVLATKPDGSWVNAGRPSRGEKVFGDPNGPIGGICASCHKVRGLGGDIGPDLSLVGSVYKRADLLTSIQEPSKTIALGFEQVMVETTKGETFIGALRQEAADSLMIKGADGQPHIVQKTDIKNRQAIPVSLMPPGLTMAMKPEDLADLLAFLETLR